MGNYQIVLSLLSSLDNGRQMKRLVDTVIDTCDAVVNLREIVLDHRIKYSVVTMDDKNRQALLERAIRSVRGIIVSTFKDADTSSNNTLI
jgi:hypothetical protein